MKENIEVFDGGVAVDDRGMVSFVNGFDFAGVKRFYRVENFSRETVRAFHGHLKEAKYVYPVSGTLLVAAVKMDDTEHPNRQNEVHRFVLSARNPKIVYIPAGYANGFKALEDGSSVIFFSTSSLEESRGDDYRFPYDYWGKEIWETENR